MTVRTRAQLLADYADNTTGAITEQKLRNLVDSITLTSEGVIGAMPRRAAFLRVHMVNSAGGGFVSFAEIALRSTVGGANMLAGGVATASSSYDGTVTPDKALDGSLATVWSSASGLPQWWQYALPSPVDFVELSITARGGGFYTQAPTEFYVLASDDGVRFDVVRHILVGAWTADNQVRTFPLSTTTAAVGVAGGALLKEVVIAGAASANFTDVITSDYDDYVLTYEGVTPGTNNTLVGIQLSADNGLTWITAGYRYGGANYGLSTNLSNYLQGTAQALLSLMPGPMGNATRSFGSVDLFAANTTDEKRITSRGAGAAGDGNVYGYHCNADYPTATKFNALRVLAAAGTLTGTFRLYGISRTVSGTPVPAALTLRGSSSAFSGAASFTVALPAGSVAGDIAFLFCFGGNAWNAPSNDSGGGKWETIDSLPAVAGLSGSIFRKALTAADIATGTVTVNTSAFASAVALVTYQPPASGNPINLAYYEVVHATATDVFNNRVVRTRAPISKNDDLVTFVCTRAGTNITVSIGTQLQAINNTISMALYQQAVAATGHVAPTVTVAAYGYEMYLVRMALRDY